MISANISGESVGNKIIVSGPKTLIFDFCGGLSGRRLKVQITETSPTCVHVSRKVVCGPSEQLKKKTAYTSSIVKCAKQYYYNTLKCVLKKAD